MLEICDCPSRRFNGEPREYSSGLLASGKTLFIDLKVGNGAHMLETDVRMSKDGVIVVCHDDNF